MNSKEYSNKFVNIGLELPSLVMNKLVEMLRNIDIENIKDFYVKESISAKTNETTFDIYITQNTKHESITFKNEFLALYKGF